MPVDHQDLIRYHDANDDNYDVVMKTIKVKMLPIIDIASKEQG
jgi:hypothetical protein